MSIVSAGEAATLANNLNGLLQGGLGNMSVGDTASAAGTIAAIGSLIGESKVLDALGISANAAGIGYDYSKYLDAIQRMQDSNPDVAEAAARDALAAGLGILAGLGGIIAALPSPQTKALGVALAAGATAAKKIVENWEGNSYAYERARDALNPALSVGYDDLMERGKELNIPWCDARDWQPPRDPLTLDLDGDGIETRSADGTVLFDHDGDGIRTGTGWVKSDDALLVLDRNGNGTIDSGAELFGVDTVLSNGSKATDGFSALRDLDSNGDGVFDAADAQFANVRLWRDLDQDGISDAGELMSLGDAGIVNISLSASTATKTLAGGNVQTATASFTRTDGSTGEAGDVDLSGTAANLDLASNPFYREFTDPVAITEQAAALPDMGGSGLVRDLREAASLSPRLAELLTQYSAATTRDAQWALLDELLDAWADTSGMAEDLDSRYPGEFAFLYTAFGSVTRSQSLVPQEDRLGSQTGGYVADVQNEALTQAYRDLVATWSNRIHILEAFNGQYFFDLPETADGALDPGAVGLSVGSSGSGGAATLLGWPERILNVSYSQGQLNLLQQSYDALKQSVYDGLVMQTRLQPYLDAVQLTIDENGVAFDFSAMEQLLVDYRSVDMENALIDLFELNRLIGQELGSMGWEGSSMVHLWITELDESIDVAAVAERLGLSVSGTFTGLEAADFVMGKGTGDRLSGNGGDDRLFGLGGSDTLNGGAGADTLVGGTGNDYLSGGTGNDLYVLGKGDGLDTIDAYDTTAGRIETLRFVDVAADELRGLRRIGSSLMLDYGSTDSVTIVNHFSSSSYRMDRFEFADGVVLTPEQLYALYPIGLTSGNDTMTFTVASETVLGGLGDDAISGDGGNDALYGEAGNDTLNGDAGDDVLDGGLGNDYLRGGAGNDVYVFDRSGAQDTISEYDTTVGNQDSVAFGAGISTDQLWFRQNGSHLEISVIGTTDKVTVNSWYSGSAYRVERFTANSGLTLYEGQVAALVSAMAAFDPPPPGQTTLPAEYQTALSPVIAASWK